MNKGEAMNSLTRSALLVVFILAGGLVCFPGVVLALPPTLSDVIVEPIVLGQGTGVQSVTVSALVFDPDGDLKNVKVVVSRKDGTKEKFKLTDDGTGGDTVPEDGRFTIQLILDTEIAERVSLRIQAKDQEKNRTRQGAIVSIVNTAVTPVLSELTVTPSILDPQGGSQVVMVSVRVQDPNGDLKNVKLDRLTAPGATKRAEKFGRLADDGTGGDLTAGDGVFTIRVPFNPLDEKPIPLRIRAKDVAKNKVALEFDLHVGSMVEPLVSAPIADTNDDGLVDGLDVSILTSRLGVRAGEVGYLEGLDVIPDGVINMLDVDAVESNFGAMGVATATPGETGTVFRGRVLDGLGNPLPGVSVQLGMGLITGETNTSGLFRMIVPAGATGETTVSFDGSSATDVTVGGGLSGQFPTIRDLPVFVNGGVDNIFRDMSLPELDLNGAVDLSDPSGPMADIGAGVFQVKLGESLVVNNAGVELRFSEGCSLTPPSTGSPLISITRVDPALLPIPLPPGQSSTLFGTFQPGGTDVNCPDGSGITVVFDNVDGFSVTDAPTFNGIENGVLQPLGDPCTVVDVDTDVEANDLDDKVQCGPIPTPFEFAWYHTAITSDPCPPTTVVGSVRFDDAATMPVVGATVTIPGVGPVMTGADGLFTVLNVPAGPNGVLCTENPFTIRASVTNGEVVSSAQSVSAVSGGITNLGVITLGDNISITLLSNAIAFVDNSQAQLIAVNEINSGVATMATPANAVDAATARVEFTVAPDQGIGTRSGTLVVTFDALGDPREFTASFSPVTFIASETSVVVDLSKTVIDFVGTDGDGLAVVSTTPLINNGVLTAGVGPGSLILNPNALTTVLLQSGLTAVDSVVGTFAYTISTVGISTRLAVGQTPCPQAASCQDVTSIQGTAVAN